MNNFGHYFYAMREYLAEQKFLNTGGQK